MDPRRPSWACFAFATVARAEDEEKKGKAVACPRPSRRASKAKYPGAKIRGISKEKNEEGETIYEVELTVKTNVDVNFDARGRDRGDREGRSASSSCPRSSRKAAAKASPRARSCKAETVAEEDGELKYEVVIETKGKKPSKC